MSGHEISTNTVIERSTPSVPRAGRDKFTRAALLTLIGGLIIDMIIGTLFTWGSISPYVTCYYRDIGNDIRLTDFYSVMPIITLVSTIAFPFGMHLTEHYGPKM